MWTDSLSPLPLNPDCSRTQTLALINLKQYFVQKFSPYTRVIHTVLKFAFCKTKFFKFISVCCHSDVDKRDAEGRTDLMVKSEENNLNEEVEELLRDGAYPNFEDDRGLTALHFALKRYSF